MFAGQCIEAGGLAFLSGILYMFRGGEFWTTGSTVLTRALWSVALACLIFVIKPVWLLALILVPVLYLTELIPTQQYSQATLDDYSGTALMGMIRGIVLAAAIGYWSGPNAILMPTVFGIAYGLCSWLGYIIPYRPVSIAGIKWVWDEFLVGISTFTILYLFLTVLNVHHN